MPTPVVAQGPQPHRHPRVTEPHPRQSPKTAEPHDPKLCSFSFRFWRQIKFFGLNQTNQHWFVALLEKLEDLSRYHKHDLVADTSRPQNTYRYHAVDWDAKNIPIKQSDLDWVDAAYRENPVEYPLMQLQISKALGRIIGFWDERDVFNIVLLDPLHNMQPSKKYSYKLHNCWPLENEHAVLVHGLDQARKHQKCVHPNLCDFDRRLNKIVNDREATDVVIMRLDATTHQMASALIESEQAESLEDILLAGIVYYDNDGHAGEGD